MQTLLEGMRTILGVPTFGSAAEGWNYTAIIEYMVASILLLCVVCNIFKILRCFFK